MFSDTTLIGLEISTTGIKLVEIKHSKSDQSAQILTFGTATHTIDLEGYWNATKLRQLSIIIEEILKKNHFTGLKTIMGIMSRHVYVTSMDFEATASKAKIQSEIDRQAPYFLPYPPDETHLSWKEAKINPTIVEYTNKKRINITALPDFVIENSKNLLEQINLDGISLENQTVSQLRSLLMGDVGNTILVDIGANQTTLSIVVDGSLRSTSQIPFGSHQITKDLASSLGLSDITAESFKQDLHLVNLFQLPKPILDFYKVLRTELSTFVELNRKIGQSPDKVILTGGGVSTAGLVEYFKDNPLPNSLPIYLGNPLRNTKVNRELMPLLSPIANQLSTAIGLALLRE